VTSRRIRLTTLIVVPLVLVATVYFVFFDNDSPDRLTRQGGGAAAAAPLAGHWTIDQSSVAGYRVREKLARLPARSDAVGRTSAITGGMDVTEKGGALVARHATVTVDLRQLKSDEERRDSRLHTSGLETDKFPTATWKSSFDIPLTPDAVAGESVSVLTQGEVTIHGITRTIGIPVDAQLDGDRIEVAGSLRFLMGDFKISPPNIANFVTVDPCATMEFRLVLTRTAPTTSTSAAAAGPPLQLIRQVTSGQGCASADS
jgi:polyisoprenoid-binding protein YceI